MEQLLPVRAGEVHFIDEQEGGDIVPLQQPPEGHGMGLNAVGAGDQQDGAVQNGHGPLGLGGEVHVARSVHQGHIQIGGGDQGLLGKDRNAAAPLQIVGVEIGVPVIHPAQSPPGAAAIQQGFGQGSFACVNMGKETNTTVPLLQLFRHKNSLLPWIISLIIPWKGAFVDRKNRCFTKSVVLPAHRNVVLPAYEVVYLGKLG